MPEDLSLTPIHPVDLGDADDGDNGQVSDEELTALAGPDAAQDTFPYYTADHGSPAAASTTALTEFARSLLADPDQASMRTTLGISGTGAPLTDMEALKAEDGGEILVHETDPGEDGTGTDLYLSQDGLGVLRQLQVRDADDTNLVDFGSVSLLPFLSRLTRATVTSNKDAIKLYPGDYGVRGDAYGNLLAGPNLALTEAILAGADHTVWNHLYYRVKSNFLYAGAGLVVQDVSDNPEMRIRRFGAPQTTALVGAPLVIGYTPVTLTTETMGTDPESLVVASTTTTGVLNTLNSTDIHITDAANFKAASVSAPRQAKIGSTWVTYTGKNTGILTGCSAHPAFTAGTAVVQSQWNPNRSEKNFSAWPDVDHGGRANFNDDYPYTLDAGGSADYAGIVVATDHSGTEEDPDPEIGDTLSGGNLRLGSVLYKRTQFGATPGMLEAVGAWQYAKGSYTVTTTPQTIILKGAMPWANKRGGTVYLEGNTTVITYTGQNGEIAGTDATTQGLGTTHLLGCTVASGSLSISDGDKIYQRIVVNSGDSLTLVVKPEPRPGASLTNHEFKGEPIGSGRFGPSVPFISDTAIPGNDTMQSMGNHYSTISWQATESHTETKQGGQLQLSTTSKGTKGNQARVTVEDYGLLNAMYGIGLGERKDLGPKNSATPSVLGGGQYAYTNVNQFTVDSTGMSAATVAASTTTPGSSSVNEVQLLTLTGAPVEGDSFTLTWVDPDAVTATSIPVVFNDTPDVPAGILLAALQSSFPSGSTTSLFQPGDLAVTHPTSTTWTVTFGTKITGTRSRWLLNNSVATTITSITDAVDGQLVTLRAANANTTLQHSSGGGDDEIRLAGGADVTLTANQIVTLVYDSASATWYELAGSGGGGALADGSVTSAKIAADAIMNSDVNSAAAIAYSKMAAMTASRALVSDSGGKVSTSAVTATEVGRLAGVTSAIQTQLNAKQPLDNELTALATATAAANTVPYFTGTSAATVTSLTAFGRSLIDDADAAAHLTTLGITASVAELNYVDGVTSSIQAQIDAISSSGISDPELLAIAALTSANDTLPYFTGSGTAALAPFTSFGRDLVAEGNAPDVLTLLGLNIVTPETFGADGTDASDDTVALQNWLAADGIKVAPAGMTYSLAGTLTFADPGDFDFGGSTIQCANSSTSKILVTGDDVTLRNLVFDGNRTGTSVVSQGVEWRGANGKCFDVESSNHNDCEGGFHLITGTPELTCVNCEAHLNGARSALDASNNLRVTSYASTSYGVDGFSCNAGTLITENCFANHNSRSGLLIGPDAEDGCVVDITTRGNASGLIRPHGSTDQRYDTYAGYAGAVSVRANSGVIKRCIMDGRDEDDADATRYGLTLGYNGGTGPLAENWKIGLVSGEHFNWTATGSAADVFRMAGGHNNMVDVVYARDITGYALAFVGGANNVASGDAAVGADHYVDALFVDEAGNPPMTMTAGRRIHIGTISTRGSAPVDIGEGSASVIDNITIDTIKAFNTTSGVFVNAGMTGAGTMENIRIGRIECFDCYCDATAIAGGQKGLVWLNATTSVGSIYSITKSGGTKPNYIVNTNDSGVTDSFNTVGEIESVDFNTAVKLVEGTSTLTVGGKSRTDLVASGQGAIALTMPENVPVGSVALATGVVNWNAIGLKKGDSITNCLAKMTTVGATLSLAKMCIATVSGTTATVVAVSANVTSTFTSGASKWAVVPCAYTVPADGMYYIGILNVGTTGVTLIRQNTLGSFQLSSGPFPFGITNAQSDLVVSNNYTVATVASSLLVGVN